MEDHNKFGYPGEEEGALDQNPFEKQSDPLDPPTTVQGFEQNAQPYQPVQQPQPNYQPQQQQPVYQQQPYQQQPQQPYQQQYQQPVYQQQPYQQQYQQPVYQQQPYQQQYQQPQYQQPQYPQYMETPEEKTAKGFGIASLVLGLVSLFCCGLLTGIPGLIFGIISIRKKKEQNGMAIAGIIICGIAIVFTTLVFVIALISSATSSYSYHRVY